PGSLLNGLSFGDGKVGRAFNFTTPGQGVRVPAARSLDVGHGMGFTVEGWIKPADATTPFPIFEWTLGNGGAQGGLWLSDAQHGNGPGSLYGFVRNSSNGSDNGEYAALGSGGRLV